MQKCRSAAQVAEDEKRFFNLVIFISGEQNIIQPKTKPMDRHADRPDNIKKSEEYKSFAGKAGSSVFRFEKRAVERAPKKAKVIFHSGRDPCHLCLY